MTTYILLLKLGSLFMTLHFFRVINVTKDSPLYYYNQLRKLRKLFLGLLLLIGLSILLPFVPLEKLQNSLSGTDKVEQVISFDPTLFYGKWDIQGELKIINYQQNRVCYLDNQKGKWTVEKNILLIKLDSNTEPRKYLINTLNDEYYEITDLESGKKFSAIALN